MRALFQKIRWSALRTAFAIKGRDTRKKPLRIPVSSSMLMAISPIGRSGDREKLSERNVARTAPNAVQNIILVWVMIIGERNKLAFEVGQLWEGSKQHQNIVTWLGEKNINEFDSIVYLPSFCTHLDQEIEKLKTGSFFRNEFQGESHETIFHKLDSDEARDLKVLEFDVTVCAAHCYLIEKDETLVVLFSFWDPRHRPESEIGKVFSVVVDLEYLLSTMRKLSENLTRDWH